MEYCKGNVIAKFRESRLTNVGESDSRKKEKMKEKGKKKHAYNDKAWPETIRHPTGTDEYFTDFIHQLRQAIKNTRHDKLPKDVQFLHLVTWVCTGWHSLRYSNLLQIFPLKVYSPCIFSLCEIRLFLYGSLRESVPLKKTKI